MSRILVIFHSRTGTARKIAMRLASERDWAIGEIETRRPASYLRCFVQALLRLRPEFDYDGPAPGAFDLVVLVSPVWCGTLAAPMRSFLARHRADIRAHVVVSVMGGRGAPGAVQAIERLLGRSALLTVALRQAEIAGNHHHAALGQFARRVEAIAGPAVPTHDRKAA